MLKSTLLLFGAAGTGSGIHSDNTEAKNVVLALPVSLSVVDDECVCECVSCVHAQHVHTNKTARPQT